MTLKPSFGIDNIIFGITQHDIFSLLGNPDKIVSDTDDDNQVICDWNQKKLRLTFYKDEGLKLGYIRTKNQNLTYNGKSIIGQNMDTFLKDNFDKSLEWKIEKYDFFNTYFNERYWLTFIVDFGIIEEVEMGVPLKNETHYDWPKLT